MSVGPRDKKILSLYRQAEIFEQMIEEQTRELYLAHKDLSTKNEYLNRIMNAMADMLLVLTPKLDIVTVNPSAVAHLGYQENEILGRPVSLVLESELPDPRVFAENVGRDAVRDKDAFITPKNGDRIPVTLSASAIRDEKGRLQGIVCVARDRTERDRMQSQQVFSQKMESIGRLAAGIAHEINTPMQFIGDNTRFLQNSFIELGRLLEEYRMLMTGEMVSSEAGALMRAREDATDMPYLLKEIPTAISQTLEGIQRVGKIVLAMKQFTHRGQDGKVFSDLNEGIASTITISYSEWKYVADLETHYDENLPRVFCYLDQINQVVLNLIVNAADAIREKVNKGFADKGKISIATRLAGDFAEISVTDNGMGIPKNIVDKIFDLFFTTKPEGKGTGQGLAIVHDIVVNKHGGSVNVKSESGVGTTFTLILPICETATQLTESMV